MSISTVCTAIAAIAANVKGITSAKDPGTPKLDTAQLPALFVLTGPATYEWFGDYGIETRQYRLQVAVLPCDQGQSGQQEARCRPLLVAVRDAFAARPGLNGVLDVLGVREASVMQDSGIIVLSTYDQTFWGFEVRVQVKETIGRTYADGN